MTASAKKLKKLPAVIVAPRLVLCLRILLLTSICLGYYYHHLLDMQVAEFWNFMCRSWWFQTVYFETLYVVAVYAVFIFLHGVIMPNFPPLQRFRLHSKGELLINPRYRNVLLEMVIYISPFALMDTFLVKKYAGVPLEEIARKKASGFIQTMRPLPEAYPTVSLMCCQLLLSFIIYDAIFFVLHYSMHRSSTLYSLIHMEHHDHPNVQSRVTNKLSLLERIALVISANESLKLVSAHPLTRFAFVPFFVWGLVENHSGFDLPWSADKLVPFGLISGSRRHFEHHLRGSRNYQPFFTYIDKWMSRSRTEKKV